MFNFKQKSNLIGVVIFSFVLLGVATGAPAVFAGTCGTAANNNYSCDATQTLGTLCASGECIIGRGIPYTPCPANIQFSGNQEEWSCDSQTTCYAKKQSGCAISTPTPTPSATIPSCTIKFTASKNDCSANSNFISVANKNDTKGFCATIANFNPNLHDAYAVCNKALNNAVTRLDPSDTENLNYDWTGTDWVFGSVGEEQCHLSFSSQGVTGSTLSSCSTGVVTVSDPVSAPSCQIKFTQSKTSELILDPPVAVKGGTKGFWSTVTGFNKDLYDAYWACQKEGGATVTKFNESDFSNHGWTGNDWKFNYEGEEICHIGFFPEGAAPKPDLSNMVNVCSTVVVRVARPGDIEPVGHPDGDVDIYDYNLLVTNFGQQGQSNPADINADGKVDIFDYNLLVTNFGKTG